jgi:hypothetical protein
MIAKQQEDGAALAATIGQLQMFFSFSRGGGGGGSSSSSSSSSSSKQQQQQQRSRVEGVTWPLVVSYPLSLCVTILLNQTTVLKTTTGRATHLNGCSVLKPAATRPKHRRGQRGWRSRWHRSQQTRNNLPPSKTKRG